ncbi:regulator of chromosome condensation-like [Uloborus diversus]|uniref:regulator of chromosome condensation-like n=1 Tax=Uloborus diversus TaxID=327109 RepID=UPI002409EA08|nr:regulator of chromosome condensation-like [Uloborus diversus]
MAQKTAQKKSKSAANIKTKTVPNKTKSKPLSNGYKETESEKASNRRKQMSKVSEDKLTSEEEVKTAVENSSEAVQMEAEHEAVPEESQKVSEIKVLKSASESNLKTEKNRKRKNVPLENGSETVQKETEEKKRSKMSKTKAKKQKFSIQVPPRKTVSGKIFVIGDNGVGALGLGQDVEEKKRPALLDLPQAMVDVAAGGMHSVCLTESGEVITFGCNDEGALGRPTSEEPATDEDSPFIPHRVEIPERIVQVCAGDSHSAALSQSGQVYIWGNFRSGDGPMGLTPDGQKQTSPIRILPGVTIVKIASGTDHFACLSADGSVYTFGCAENGQLGRVPERRSRNGGRGGLATLLEPNIVHVSSSSKSLTIDEVWTGDYATFLRAHDTGSIWAFGLNNYNHLGYEGERVSFIPKKVSSFDNKEWKEISGGQHHTLTLDTEGLVYSMGRKDYGRLGLGENCDDTSSPTVIPTLANERCTNVSCGGNCVSFAVTEQGYVFSWGLGDNYQLGHGDDEDRHVPKQIEGNFAKSWKVLKVAGGGMHTLILACPRESTTTTSTK